MLKGLRPAFARIRAFVYRTWMAVPDDLRPQIVALVLLAGTIYSIHYAVFCLPQPFYVEDSAISFAYARNLVHGDGLVPYAGGERVEGYSNALWTFLIAGWYAVGVPVWFSSKMMGYAFGLVALWSSFWLVRRARGEHAGVEALVAPVLLAASTQFVLHNASGLENSLFCMLLAGGALLLAREIQDGVAAPWSAIVFFLLTMTRPDGLAYAAVALFTRVCGTLWRGQWRALLFWILAAGLPFAAYNAWRYEYFGWWWPNTYYAKEKLVRPYLWSGAGWKMVRDYLTKYGIVYAVPLLVFAMTGLRSRKRWIGVGLLALFATVILWDGRTGIPAGYVASDPARWLVRKWGDVRVGYLLGGSALLGLLTFGRRGWEVRGLLWASFCSGVFFCVWAGGDWMKGFRWFNLTSVPMFTLMAIGVGELVAILPLGARRLRGVFPVGAIYGVAIVLAIGIPNIVHTSAIANDPETQPRDVQKRVNYMSWVQRRLGLEHVSLLDVDMGAHLWYTDWEIPDMAGLIDVPVSRHKWQTSFADDYVFRERRPDFAHVHGNWGKTTGLLRNEQWYKVYVEIPGYPSGRRALHVGNHVRKDLLASREYSGQAERFVGFADGITLDGWDIPSPTIAPGGKLYVATTWQAADRNTGFRVLAFLASESGEIHAAEVAPGYDWYRPERWEYGEHVNGRWNIAIPERLPAGKYDFGMVLLDEATGAVLPAQVESVGPPRYMQGEWLVRDAVELVPAARAIAAADADHADALAKAAGGDCAGAREGFRNARRHIARNEAWHLERVDAFNDAAVDCLVARAKAEADPVAQAAILIEAKWIDHRHAGFVAMASELAGRLEQLGDERSAPSGAGVADPEGAFEAYTAAVNVDGTRVWARRKAEAMRDLRLGIEGKKPEKKATPKKAEPKKTPPRKPGQPRPLPSSPRAVDSDGADSDAAGSDEVASPDDEGPERPE